MRTRTFSPTDERRFESLLRERGIEIDASRFRKLIRYSDLLRTWGEKTNLAGPKVLSDPWPSIVEALEPLRFAGESVGRLVDIGSGGGLPAIPLAIGWPVAKVTLLEPRKKRWAFLRFVLQELEIAGEVQDVRWEEFLASRPEEKSIDVLSSRALGGASERLVGFRPLLKESSLVLLFAGGKEKKLAPEWRGFRVVTSIDLAEAGHFLVALRIAEFVPRGTQPQDVAE